MGIVLPRRAGVNRPSCEVLSPYRVLTAASAWLVTEDPLDSARWRYLLTGTPPPHPSPSRLAAAQHRDDGARPDEAEEQQEDQRPEHLA